MRTYTTDELIAIVKFCETALKAGRDCHKTRDAAISELARRYAIKAS